MLHTIWHFKFTDFYFLHLRKYLKGNQFEYFYTIIYQLAQNNPFFPDFLHFILAILVNLP